VQSRSAKEFSSPVCSGNEWIPGRASLAGDDGAGGRFRVYSGIGRLKPGAGSMTWVVTISKFGALVS